MFLLPSLGLGIVLALVVGGKPSRLAAVRFRHSWLVLLALGIQVVLFSHLTVHAPVVWIETLHVGSYALLMLFAWANLRITALVPVLVGLVLNALPIAANGGRMPLSASAAHAVGLAGYRNVSLSAHRLAFLGDMFALPRGVPLANVFSIGDVMIGVGVVTFIVLISLGCEPERPLDRGRALRPFRHRGFRLLAAGKLLSHGGAGSTTRRGRRRTSPRSCSSVSRRRSSAEAWPR